MRPPFSLEHLQALLRLVEQAGLEELTVEEGDQAVTIRALRAVPSISEEARVPPPFSLPAPPASPPEVAEEWVPLRAPIVGIFYRAPAPDEPPFVEEGDWVEVGQTVGLIEAMKIFNEVVAEVAGRVERIVAQNGRLVHPGDVLLWVNPSAPPPEERMF